MLLSDDQKAVYLALAVSAMESIRSDEFDRNPKSARHRMINDLIDRCLKAVDYYRMDAMGNDKLNKVGAIIDQLQAMLSESGL